MSRNYKYGSTRPERFTLATCVDGNIRLHAELILWVICAKRWLPIEQFEIVVYLIDHQDSVLEHWLDKQGVKVCFRKAPVPKIPHCNRLAAFMDHHNSDAIVVTDSDLFFTGNPIELFAKDNVVRAAPNNACNPPPYIFKRLIRESGLDSSYRPTFTLLPGSTGRYETHLNNISAGIIALPSGYSVHFAGVWKKWANWLSDRKYLLEVWVGHIDQIAFSLACEEELVDVNFLPPQVNLILHLLTKVETIYALHLSSAHIPDFSHLFNQNKTLDPSGLSEDVVVAVDALNLSILYALTEMERLPSIRHAAQTFLNPKWTRS